MPLIRAPKLIIKQDEKNIETQGFKEILEQKNEILTVKSSDNITGKISIAELLDYADQLEDHNELSKIRIEELETEMQEMRKIYNEQIEALKKLPNQAISVDKSKDLAKFILPAQSAIQEEIKKKEEELRKIEEDEPKKTVSVADKTTKLQQLRRDSIVVQKKRLKNHSGMQIKQLEQARRSK